VQRGDWVEQVARIATRRESRRRTRYEEQHHESPRQGEDEDGKDVRERRTDEVSKWTQQEGEWGCDDQEGKDHPRPVDQQAAGQPEPRWFGRRIEL